MSILLAKRFCTGFVKDDNESLVTTNLKAGSLHLLTVDVNFGILIAEI